MRHLAFEDNKECASYLQAYKAFRNSPQHKLSDMPPELALRSSSDMHDYAFCVAETDTAHKFQIFSLEMSNTSVDENMDNTWMQPWISLTEYTSPQMPLFIGRVGEELLIFSQDYSSTHVQLLKIVLRTKVMSVVDVKCHNQELKLSLENTCCMVTDEVDKLYFLCIPGSQGLVMNGCKILQYNIENKNLKLLATISDKFNSAPKLVSYNTELYVFGIKVERGQSYLVAYSITNIDSAHPITELVTTDQTEPGHISTVTVLGNKAVIRIVNNIYKEEHYFIAKMYQFDFEEYYRLFSAMPVQWLLHSVPSKGSVAYKGFVFYFDTSEDIERYNPKTGKWRGQRGTTISGNCCATTSVSRLQMKFNY